MLQTVTKRVEQPEPNAGDNRQAVPKAKLFIEKSILKNKLWNRQTQQRQETRQGAVWWGKTQGAGQG